MKKIYLPSGMRDNILSEAKTKKELQDCFEKVFSSVFKLGNLCDGCRSSERNDGDFLRL